MNPGLELDKLVATFIMGWEEVEEYEGLDRFMRLQGIKRGTIASKNTGYKPKVPIPNYSTEIAAAWTVADEMKFKTNGFSLHYETMVSPDRKWRAHFGSHVAEGETAPLALCLAAIKACGIPLEITIKTGPIT